MLVFCNSEAGRLNIYGFFMASQEEIMFDIQEELKKLPAKPEFISCTTRKTP